MLRRNTLFTRAVSAPMCGGGIMGSKSSSRYLPSPSSPFAVPHPSLDLSSVRFYTTSSSSSGGDEPLELEVQFEGEGSSTAWVDESKSQAEAERQAAEEEAQQMTSGSPFDDLKGTTLNVLDTFVTSRVANCLKRVNGAAAGQIRYRTTKEPKKDKETGKPIHKAEVSFLINGTTYRGIGYAIGDPKDAEVACAHHIERILDHLGIVMFMLSRKQEAHAVAAKADGRDAPLPGGKPKSAAEAAKKTILPIKYRFDRASRKANPSGNVFLKKVSQKPGIEPAMVDAGAAAPSNAMLQQFRLQGAQDILNRKSQRVERAIEQQGITEITLEEDGVGSVDAWSRNPHFTCKILPRKPSLQPHNRARDETEGGAYGLVEPNNGTDGQTKSFFHHTDLTLLSPCLFSPDSFSRVEAWWTYTKQPGTFSSSIQITPQKVKAFGSELFEGRLELPFAKGTYAIAKGINPSQVRKLVAMHFELLIDSHGVPLFPMSNNNQRQHADDLKCVGRWAIDHVPKTNGPADIGGGSVGANALATVAEGRTAPPKGLKEWVGMETPRERVYTMQKRIAPLSEHEELVAYHRSILNTISHHVTEMVPKDSAGYPANFEGEWNFGKPVDIMRQFLVDKGQKNESYYLIINYSGKYRATLALPLPLDQYGVRGGFAIAPTVKIAKEMCAYHSIDILCTAGVPIFSDKAKQAAFLRYRKSKGLFIGDEPNNGPRSYSPPGLRHCFGSITVEPPPSRDFDYAYGNKFFDFTCIEPCVPDFKGDRENHNVIMPHDYLEECAQKCYVALFGSRSENPNARGSMFFHMLSTTNVRWDADSGISLTHNVSWMRRPVKDGELHDPLPLAVGRCVQKRHSERECLMHFVHQCIRLYHLSDKLASTEFVDEEVLPVWFGRGPELKKNAQLMRDALNIQMQSKSNYFPPTLRNLEHDEENMMATELIVGAPVRRTVGFTSRYLWEKAVAKRNARTAGMRASADRQASWETRSGGGN